MSVQTECRTWKLVFESYAEVQPDFAKQRYNLNTPKSKFFRHLISHPYFFKQLSEAPNPFIYKHFRTFFKRKKKWNRDIPFHRIPISKMYVTRAFPYSISTEIFPSIFVPFYGRMVLSDWFKRFAAILAIFAILRFINNRWLHHFYRMPCVGRNNAAMIASSRGKKNAIRLVATFVKDYFISRCS